MSIFFSILRMVARLRSYSAILFYCVVLLSIPCQADTARKVAVILSAENGPYQIFVNRLRHHARNNSEQQIDIYPLNHNQLQSAASRTIIQQADVVISAGSLSTAGLTNHDNSSKYIAALITRDQFAKIAARSGNNVDCAAVIDQPYRRQFEVIKQVIPEIKIIGMITSNSDREFLLEITKTAAAHDLKIHIEGFSNNIHSTIRNLAENGTQGILAIPDKRVYNSTTARNILISSYHFNLPIVSYSSSFVKAGSLLGVYSSPSSLADRVHEIIKNPELCTSEKIIYPREYTVEINPHVAESLNINLKQHKKRITFTDELSYE